MTDRSPSPDELAHYGVKGMKWGVRRSPAEKARLNKPNPNYSKSQRNYDRKNFSTKAVVRINRRMNQGQDLKTARKNEVKFRRRRYNAVAGAYVVARYSNPQTRALLGELGRFAAASVAKRAETKRGQARVAEQFGLPRTATTGPTYAKKNRNNVYKISDV